MRGGGGRAHCGAGTGAADVQRAAGALAATSAADAEVTARVARLLDPPARLPLHVQALVCGTAALLVAIPVTLLLFSF